MLIVRPLQQEASGTTAKFEMQKSMSVSVLKIRRMEGLAWFELEGYCSSVENVGSELHFVALILCILARQA